MLGRIALTASMRSNLLSLRNVSAQLGRTQKVLSTGNKINSAIENASSYYQARSLTNRASDLNGLLDSIGQGIQTIRAAANGLENALTYLEQAKAVANQAVNVEVSETENIIFKRTKTSQIMRFYDILKKNSINVTIRKEFGSKISAACGQLRAENEKE